MGYEGPYSTLIAQSCGSVPGLCKHDNNMSGYIKTSNFLTT